MRGAPLMAMLLVSAFLQAQAPAKTVTELRIFFAANCVKCHGTDGSAHSPEGKKLGGFDFTDTAKAGKETDAEMVKTIRNGLFFGFRMPSFKDRLTEADAQTLVREILRKAEKGKAIAPMEGAPR
jgi:mono/diheme cytochrome c family protein